MIGFGVIIAAKFGTSFLNYLPRTIGIKARHGALLRFQKIGSVTLNKYFCDKKEDSESLQTDTDSDEENDTEISKRDQKRIARAAKIPSPGCYFKFRGDRGDTPYTHDCIFDDEEEIDDDESKEETDIEDDEESKEETDIEDSEKSKEKNDAEDSTKSKE